MSWLTRLKPAKVHLLGGVRAKPLSKPQTRVFWNNSPTFRIKQSATTFHEPPAIVVTREFTCLRVKFGSRVKCESRVKFQKFFFRVFFFSFFSFIFFSVFVLRVVTVISDFYIDVCSKYYKRGICFSCPMDAIARCPLLVAVFWTKFFQFLFHPMPSMGRSNRNFNTLPHPGQSPGIWTFEDWIVQIPAPQA